MSATGATGFGATVILLLKNARRRANGRQRRQQELLNQRRAGNFRPLMILLGVVVMGAAHVMACFAVIGTIEAGQYLEIRRQGLFEVSDTLKTDVQQLEQSTADHAADAAADLNEQIARAAREDARDHGGDSRRIAQDLEAAVARDGSARLVSSDEAEPGLPALDRAGPWGKTLGGMVMVFWLAMICCQGEGLELDLQRRRHPLWEWLLSHPVRAEAVFLAEMLAPVASNPSYWTAPLFVGLLHGVASQSLGAGLLTTVGIGIPLAVAAACVGKALEIGAMLRLSPNTRGAVIGILGWFGYASFLGMFFIATKMSVALPALAQHFGGVPRVLEALFAPIPGLLLGQQRDGSFSLLRAFAFGWTVSGALIMGAVVFSARSVRQGLSGAFASQQFPARPARLARFGKQPLYRKELLWFVRDRSAIVQTILIPLSVASYQLFNMRSLIVHAGDSWNYLSGAAILFGTYFLLILGPRSLASEGTALWIAMTWPLGLESLLKAKAWLWTMIVSGMVLPILLWGAWMFPHDAWKIALVGAAWLLFAHTMAQKAVTLVSTTSESGEVTKPSSARRWGASLGMLSFAIGICTQQWQLAVIGLVYSWISSAALWESLRAHLPYLYDPWSEVLPPPPTLLHAMVAIGIMVECLSIITGIAALAGGPHIAAIAQNIAYAVVAVFVSLGFASFLGRRGVSLRSVWTWPDHHGIVSSWRSRWLLIGPLTGAGLGVLAHGYIETISLIPSVGKAVQLAHEQLRADPMTFSLMALVAIVFAPLAEEFLFRGVLYRALDRQWGNGLAVAGAAAFFAIYHPPLAWLPVGLVGAANCMLFKRSGQLLPAVLLHVAYNTVVVLWT